MTATFEFVCETFVITYKGKICSDSNKYIVSYGTELSGSEDLLHDVNVLINFASWAALLLVRLLT